MILRATQRSVDYHRLQAPDHWETQIIVQGGQHREGVLKRFWVEDFARRFDAHYWQRLLGQKSELF